MSRLRILFVVDGRSPIAMNWVQGVVAAGHEVHLASTFPFATDVALASSRVFSVGFSAGLGGSSARSVSPGAARRYLPAGARAELRHWLAPLTLEAAARRLQTWVRELKPDLIHAMRIPYEGMLAARAQGAAPLLVSIWGNDFTLHARSTRRMARLTRESLQRASAIHADCQRDIRLAMEWGFSVALPTLVLPGAGGVQPELFFPPAGKLLPEGDAPLEQEPIVINPRGVRAYVRNDTFFKAARRVIDQRPGVRFTCPGMAGSAQMLRWVRELSLDEQVLLLPLQTRAQMATHFQQALVAVSPSTHDGTPNTLLEAMACACFPIAGDIESLREWIVPGVNGLLVDPGDPAALADGILLALDQRELRWRAGQLNQQLIAERATYPVVMSEALSFYESLAAREANSR